MKKIWGLEIWGGLKIIQLVFWLSCLFITMFFFGGCCQNNTSPAVSKYEAGDKIIYIKHKYISLSQYTTNGRVYLFEEGPYLTIKGGCEDLYPSANEFLLFFDCIYKQLRRKAK